MAENCWNCIYAEFVIRNADPFYVKYLEPKGTQIFGNTLHNYYVICALGDPEKESGDRCIVERRKTCSGCERHALAPKRAVEHIFGRDVSTDAVLLAEEMGFWNKEGEST